MNSVESYEDILAGGPEEQVPFDPSASETGKDIYATVHTPGWACIKKLIDDKVSELTHDLLETSETGEKLLRMQCKAQSASELKTWLENQISASIAERSK